jgi:gliding motility-associated-like protein
MSYIYYLSLLVFSSVVSPQEDASDEAAEIIQQESFMPTVDAGPDVIICEPGETVTLNAITSPDVLYVEWTPAQFLGNPLNATTTATVGTTTTFTVTAGAPGMQNLWLNGDFANPNLRDNYTQGYADPSGGMVGPLTEPGQVVVSNDPSAENTNFTNIGDITGEGNMLVANGAIQPGQPIICQDVPVTPNTTYLFSAFAASVEPNSPAILRVTINGNVITEFALSPVPGDWGQFTGVWNSGALSTNANVCITNLNTEWNGNDFAIDGITFTPFITTSDQVTIQVADIDASFETPDSVCLTENPIDLNDLLSPTATPGGTWLVDGTPSFFFEPAFSGEGLHLITYSVSVPPCMEESTETIFVTAPPSADWDGPELLCDTSPEENMNEWLLPMTEPGGFWNINGMPADSIFDPASLGVGIHIVGYTAGELATGCTTDFIDTVEVLPQPIASWTPPGPVCADNGPLYLDSLLNPSATPGGQWLVNGIDTHIIYPAQLNPAEYIVSYTASNPVCDSTQTDTITIIGSLDASFVLSADTACLNDSLLLTFTGMANNTTVFNWNFGGATSTPGNDEGPHTLTFPDSGFYDISLWLEEAGCTSDTTTLSAQIYAPLPSPMPVCGPSSNSELSISWPSVAGAEDYTVEVITGQSGGVITDTTFLIGGLLPGEEVQIVVTATANTPCLPAASDTITCATLDCTPPDVEITPVDAICLDSANNTTITLDVTTSVGGGTGSWSGPGITDTIVGIFDPLEAGLGNHIIQYTYEVNNCVGSDTALISVLPIPEAEFTLADSICIGDTTIITFTGTSAGQATYNWNFDGGTSPGAASDALQHVSWNTAGVKYVSLQMSENGCTGAVYTDSIVVAPTLTTPQIQCLTTETSVEFFWNNQAGTDSFTVLPLNGFMGILTTDTSYLFNGLMPEDTVGITLIAHSATPCPDVMTEQYCVAASCPDIDLSIATVEDICRTGNTPSFALNAIVSDGDTAGNYTWAGPGIIDNTNGIFSPEDADIGINTITLDFQRGSCLYTATIDIIVQQTPTSLFSLSTDTLCVLDELTLNYDGNASVAADYHWDFGTASATPGTGQGPHQLSWPQAGNELLSLWVEENGCVSDTSSLAVLIEPELEPVVISCSSTYSSITFSWNSIPNVDSFMVNTLNVPAGSRIDDTTYLVEGLQADQSASIELTAISSNACPSYSIIDSCTTLPCPNVLLDITPLPGLCFTGMPDTVDIDFIISGNQGAGSISWSGPGIQDTAIAQWVTDASQVGQSNMLIATWEEDVCSVSDTVFLEVFDTPIADFTAPSVACQADTITVTFSGTADPDATYNWAFGLANTLSGTGSGPYELQWDDAGNHPLSLWIEQNGCVSDTAVATITIDPILATPTVDCEASYSSILFTWLPVPNSTGYTVTPLPGTPAGTMVADTAYLIENLEPDMLYEAELTVLSDNTCADATQLISCTTLACPDIELSINPPADPCITDQPDTLHFTYGLTGTLGDGTLSWQGDGIMDADTGLWLTGLQQVGAPNTIILTWSEDVCSVSDTLAFELFEIPSATFTADSAICVAGTANISYTGNADASANFNWDFDGATVISGTGVGPYELQWPAAGTYSISLEVTENGCVSESVTHAVLVEPELEPLIISCESFLSSVEFSWLEIGGANEYLVEVLNGGPNGAFINDTTYRIENLMPGETVEIEVTAVSEHSCPNITATASCTTSDCPNVQVGLSATSEVCLGSGSTLTISFSGDESGPFNITYTVGGVPASLDNISNDTTLAFTLDATTEFLITGIENLGAVDCPTTLPPMAITTVSNPVSAGIDLGPLEICSRTDSTISLSDRIEGETDGGAWGYTSGPAMLPGSFDPALGTFSILNQEAGTYTFTYEVAGVGSCPDASVTTDIIILERPVADAGQDATLSCTNNEILIGGPATSQGSNILYQWTTDNGSSINNPNQQSIMATQPGTYFLEVTNTVSGCTDNSQASVDLDESFLLPFASLSDVSCFAAEDGAIVVDSVIGGTPPYLYGLNDAPLGSSPVFDNLIPGNYEVLIEDASGCQSTLSFNLTAPNELTASLVASFEGNENEVILGQNVTLTANVNVPESEIQAILWQPDSISCDSCFNASFIATETTTFSIMVIDNNGCTSSDELSLFVRKDEGVYVPTIFSPNGDGTNDLFTLYTGPQVEEIVAFHIYSRWGEEVHKRDGLPPNVPELGWDGTFRGEPLNPGVFVYYAELKLVDGSEITVSGDVVLMK